MSTFAHNMDRTIMPHLPKLTGTNWHEWQKEIETYFMLIGCGGHIDSVRPGGDKALAWDQTDQKVYAVIWFLTDPNYRSPIITTKSGKEAWSKLVAEYQKDNATNRILLRQQFYSITHYSSASIPNFIEGVLTVARRLEAIGHKPDDLKITDKILIGLDPSWAPVRTALMLRTTSLTIDEIASALKQYEANEMGVEMAVKKEDGESALIARGKRGVLGSKEKADENDADFDWGNTRNREGVCYRCGRPRHIAQFCVANMPEEVKRRILNHTANTAILDGDDNLFAFAAAEGTSPTPLHQPSNNPLLVIPKKKKKKHRFKTSDPESVRF